MIVVKPSVTAVEVIRPFEVVWILGCRHANWHKRNYFTALEFLVGFLRLLSRSFQRQKDEVKFVNRRCEYDTLAN